MSFFQKSAFWNKLKTLFLAYKEIAKTKYDALDNQQFKKKFLNAVPFWTAAFITGVAAVMYAKLFAWAEGGTSYIYTHFGWGVFIFTPFCFYVAWWLVYKYSPYARGSGIPQVMASIELTKPKYNYKVGQMLSIRSIVVKVASSIIMIFGGGAIGREGPTIQIAASIFKKINDYLPSWYPKISKRNMIVTGAAAGLAAAFNTPLGGIVFAIEEITKTHFSYFKSALLVGVIISGLTALNLLGPYLYLGYPHLEGIELWTLTIIIPVALIAGMSGSIMGNSILWITKKRKTVDKKWKFIVFPIICGLLMAAIGYFLDIKALGSGKGIMITTLFSEDKHLNWYLPILRVAGTVISFSTGAAGGIFAPSLSAGASIGSVIAGWFEMNGAETNLVILCGMVACLTGITKSPFTSSIIVIEMTNSHNIIFYLMLTALVANIAADGISKHSFYDYLRDQFVDEVKNGN